MTEDYGGECWVECNTFTIFLTKRKAGGAEPEEMGWWKLESLGSFKMLHCWRWKMEEGATNPGKAALTAWKGKEMNCL